MDEIDIPQYFLCPISLQIMSDPVTTVTGITYDRKAIEQWLTTADATAVCPVTKLPLPKGSDLTPNHMLRRLIQAWCVANSQNGIDRIPTPKAPVHRSLVLKLIRDLNKRGDGLLNINALKRMEELVSECEKNRDCMTENGVGKSVIMYVLRCFRNGLELSGIDVALRVLLLTWTPTVEIKQIVEENFEFLQSIFWILNSDLENHVKTQALIVLKNSTEMMNSISFEKLNSNFFNEMVKFLRLNISPAATKAVLRILIQTCPPGRNRTKTVEAGAVPLLIELEFSCPEKKTTELIFCLLAHLCSCADGRQQFLQHPGSVAMLAKRLLRVSPATDDRALCIFDSIARFSATRGVVAEMLTVGAVTKLCMVLQASCEGYLKTKAREVLRMHWKDWSNSPCIQVYLLTMYTKH